MTLAGDIRSPYATRAKEYVWSAVCDVLPRGITPTDEDACLEVNWCFLTFEGKTEGKRIDKGQGLYLSRKLRTLPMGRAVVVVGTHPDLHKVDLNGGLTTVQWCWRTNTGIAWSKIHDGHALHEVLYCYARDAEGGALKPWTWSEYIAYQERPYYEPEESMTLMEYRASFAEPVQVAGERL